MPIIKNIHLILKIIDGQFQVKNVQNTGIKKPLIDKWFLKSFAGY